MTVENKEETKDLLALDPKGTEEQEKDTEKEPKQDDPLEVTPEVVEDEDEQPTLEQIRANVRQHETDLAEEREEIAFYENKLQNIQKDLVKGLPDIVANGKSIYEMTPEEFEDVIDQTYQVHDREKATAIVAEARQARKKYLEEAKKYAPSAVKFRQDAEKFRAKEWNLAEQELRKLYPGIEKYADQIKNKAVEELNADKVLVERVNQGVVAKFRYLINLVKSEGIEDKLTKAELKTEQGNREKASAGKGKGSSASESRGTAYTPERLRSMRQNLDEYRAQKDKIYAYSGEKKK
jgi:hypothetical protein